MDERTCEHEWQITEVVLETNAADTTAVCIHCGATGVQAGQGRRVRPELPDIRLTIPEAEALRRRPGASSAEAPDAPDVSPTVS